MKENQMTHDDIIRMAREAGCGWAHNGTQPSLVGEEMLERFAALVAAAEREACCKIVYGQCESDNVAQRTVDAIRARSEV
jgi:hypothetical protein